MENFLKNFPSQEELMNKSVPSALLLEVNGHIHTPYSFSAFSGVNPIFEKATEEDVKILGINDFYTTGGFLEFHDNAVENWIFPLFNIEFIALDRALQQQGIRVNDPNNPGRTYFSGKGLDFPDTLDAVHAQIIESVKQESLLQVATMVDKTNQVLSGISSGIRLDYQEIRKNYARDLVRERHIAKALRIAIFDQYPDIDERKAFFTDLFGGKAPQADLTSFSAVEIEIRNNLLKAGGKAFVEEDEKAFLSVDAVIDIITHAGGIPCYPVLLDDAKGNITDYESNKEVLYDALSRKGIFCIELMPGRNDAKILSDFVHYFHSNGFIVLFGTEHNSPDMIPLTVSCRHQVPLTSELKTMNFEGGCIIAAHQYFRAKGLPSPVMRWNQLDSDSKEQIIRLGKTIVYHFTHN